MPLALLQYFVKYVTIFTKLSSLYNSIKSVVVDWEYETMKKGKETDELKKKTKKKT